MNNTTATKTLFSSSSPTKTIPTEHELSQDLVLFEFIFQIISALITLVAVWCSFTNIKIYRPFANCLRSYSVANFLGNLYTLCISSFDYFQVQHEFHAFNGAVCATVLSFTHLICLVLAEYSLEINRNQNAEKSFGGLLCLAWVLSLSMGSVLFFLHEHTLSALITSVMLITCLGFVTFNCTKLTRMRAQRFTIDAMRARNERHDESYTGEERILFPLVCLALYYVCGLPWAIGQQADRIANHLPGIRHHNELDVLLHIVYTLNYVFISLVIVYLRMQKRCQVVA